MEFSFSVRGVVKDAWRVFLAHWQFFVGTALVTVIFNFIGRSRHIPMVVSVILMVAVIVWSFVMIKISLSAADGRGDLLSFKKIRDFLPSLEQFLMFIGVGVLSALIVLGGLVLLVIPGLYFGFRVGLASLAYVDRGESIGKSLRYSWDLTKGSIFWTMVLVSIVAMFLYFVGFILFGVGILVTYPLSLIIMAKFYRALSLHHAGIVVPQPAEIPPVSSEEGK